MGLGQSNLSLFTRNPDNKGHMENWIENKKKQIKEEYWGGLRQNYLQDTIEVWQRVSLHDISHSLKVGKAPSSVYCNSYLRIPVIQ